MPDFIPAGDSDLLDWSANFNTKLTAAPTDYGLVAGDATAYAALHTDYNTKLTAATNPATRTSVTIADKDTSRDTLVAKARQLVRIIQASTATDDADRAELQIAIPDTAPTTIAPPSSKPVVNIEQIQNLAHKLRVRDELTPTTNAKPEGALGAEVWRKIGPGEPLSIAECDYMGLATSRFFTATHEAGDVGKTAYYILRWINAKGEAGPTADQVSATIAA